MAEQEQAQATTQGNGAAPAKGGQRAERVPGSSREVYLRVAEALSSPPSGVVEIPVARISDNNIHRYSIDDRGLTIRFFVLRTGLGKFATAFDACYACYSYGRYYLKNGQLICSQCDAPSPLSKLHATKDEAEPDENNSGSMEGNGCTPIYLPSRQKAGNIEIKLADLQSKRKYFDISGDEK